MQSLGIKKSGLDKFIVEGFKLLNLITYFTSGKRKAKLGLFLKDQMLQMQLVKFIQTLKKVLLQLK